MSDFRYWTNGRFDPVKAGRPAQPAKDDVGVWRDYTSGAPCDPPGPTEQERVDAEFRLQIGS